MDESLTRFLLNPESYPHPVQGLTHLETHISHVFLTGIYAYKIKKPLYLGFLDYHTLEKRQNYCTREVVLNRRFAPNLYEGVITLSENNGRFSFDGPGKVIEYAVKMRQFPPGALFSELLAAGKLSEPLVMAISRRIADFHRTAEPAPSYWSLESVRHIVLENFDVFERSAALKQSSAKVADLRQVFESELERRASLIRFRQSHAVRFLHGDLHLRNICLFEGEPTLFDGIEFNDEFACCDVWADFAFLLMDFFYREHSGFAWTALNTYLEERDDFEGLPLFRLYVAYRAAVRAKVSCLELETVKDLIQREHAARSVHRHLDLARLTLQEAAPRLIAIGGYSGSGKSTLAQALAARGGAAVIRSDAVRKHMIGIAPLDRAPPHAYHPAVSEAVYQGMRDRAKNVLDAGLPCIVDAVHADPAERAAIESLARSLGAPFQGIWCEAPEQVAAARVRLRKNDASDADASVVTQQYRKRSSAHEWYHLNTEQPVKVLVTKLCNELNLPKARSISSPPSRSTIRRHR